MKRLFSLHFVPLFTAHWTALTMQPVLSDVYLGSLSLEETAEIQATHCEVIKLINYFFVLLGVTTLRQQLKRGEF